MPIVFDYKKLRPNSGGAGRSPGGDGQSIRFWLRTTNDWTLSAMTTRLDRGPDGLDGGGPGATGEFLINGKPARGASKRTMSPDDDVQFETPGGGGYGPPAG
jgi:N-methylhydantoinase B/oxoprolinase/acetone carboxylase alpha subunit